ncbi:hypothetical protein ACJX0J_027614 [Zea mays]
MYPQVHWYSGKTVKVQNKSVVRICASNPFFIVVYIVIVNKQDQHHHIYTTTFRIPFIFSLQIIVLFALLCAQILSHVNFIALEIVFKNYSLVYSDWSGLELESCIFMIPYSNLDATSNMHIVHVQFAGSIQE